MTPQSTRQATRPRNGPVIRANKQIGLWKQPIDARKGERRGRSSSLARRYCSTAYNSVIGCSLSSIKKQSPEREDDPARRSPGTAIERRRKAPCSVFMGRSRPHAPVIYWTPAISELAAMQDR